MKRWRAESARLLFVTAIFLACLAIAPVGPQGCAPVSGPTLSQSATDSIILRAEQAAEAADLTFNTFVHIERDNEALLLKVNPAIHAWADTVRANGQNWIRALRSATKTFKANRSPENQATLATALATLNDAASKTNQLLTQAKKASQP